MRILLPPSAGKTTKESTNHLQLEKLWQAEHLTQTRRQLIDDVQNTALLADAAQIFKLGPKNAHEISQNLEVYDAPALAAWQLYDGVLYEAAKFAQIFSYGACAQDGQGQGQGNQPQGSGQGQLEELTLVFSALFGPVRLTDLITPHRLSGSVKLPGRERRGVIDF